MIRQPDLVDLDFALQVLEQIKKKKPHNILLAQVKFEEIIEGDYVQILHLGSYDNESESFKLMDNYIELKNFRRISTTHREINLSDTK